MNYIEELKSNEKTFLTFLSEKYPFFYNSNLFLRDLQYAIHNYFKLKGDELGFSETEILAFKFAEYMVKKSKLVPVNDSTWRVMIDIAPKKTEKLEETES